jgi:predicted Na+-dependent transporter
VALIGTLAFVGVTVKLLNLTKWAKGEVGKRGLLAIVAFVLLSMLLGWILGGPRKFTRPVLASASSMRNIALGLAIAVRSFDIAVLTPLVAFAAIMVPLNSLYMIVSKAAGKKGENKPAAR